MVAEKREHDIGEIAESIGKSEVWIRKMEREGYLKLSSPKVRGGRVRRLFNQGDVVNIFHVAGLASVGFGPERLKGYKRLVTRFREFVQPFLKKLFRDPEDQFFVFHPRDVFPDGDPDNIDWSQFNHEENVDHLSELQELYAQAQALRRVVRGRIKTLKHIELGLDNFIEKTETGLRKTLLGGSFVGYFKE